MTRGAAQRGEGPRSVTGERGSCFGFAQHDKGALSMTWGQGAPGLLGFLGGLEGLLRMAAWMC
jgi:hypothetical protein